MSRTIIEVLPADEYGSAFYIWLYEPRSPGGAQAKSFPYSAGDPIPVKFQSGVGGVGEIGQYILDALCEHPAVKNAIQALLQSSPGMTQPLLVRMSAAAEGVPWETLFANGLFLALDQRWPIARTSPWVQGTWRKDFQPPLRVMVILAADDADATSEWLGLLKSLETARFPVSVSALVADEKLLKKIAGTRSRVVSVEAQPVPLGREIIEVIKGFGPHILHFFCHGLTEEGIPYLQIGTLLSSIKAGKPLKLGSAELRQVLGEDLWLVTLNCCRSATAADGVGSLAFTLMLDGAPLVVAMREPVSDTDANAFSRVFYRALMSPLGKVAAQPGQEFEIDWPATLYEPRMELCEAHRGSAPCLVAAQSIRAWTLPVLYMGCGSFILRGEAPPADSRPIGAVSSQIPPRLLQLLGLRRDAAPALTEEERAAAQVQLLLLRQLVDQQLGAPPEAVDEYRRRIKELEVKLYGNSSRTPEPSREPEP